MTDSDMAWTSHVGGRDGVSHPFAPERFVEASRDAARDLWAWTDEVGRLPAARRNGGEPASATHIDSDLRERAARRAREIGEREEAVLGQLEMAHHVADGAGFEHFRDIDAVLEGWPLQHGRLLAQLAGLGQNWRRPMLDEFWRSSFLARRLVEIPAEAEHGVLWIPRGELDALGADAERLRSGDLGEPERKLLWKQVVRIRERLVHALPLFQDVPRRYRRAFKSYWFGLLELLDEIERRDFDLWSVEVRLSPRQQRIVRLQSWLTRATFKRS